MTVEAWSVMGDSCHITDSSRGEAYLETHFSISLCEAIIQSGEGGSYMVEHGKWPILSTEFGKMVYILADFGI